MEEITGYKELSFSNTEDFFKFINPNNDFWNNEQHVWGFRGQANTSWLLQPSLLRHNRFEDFLFDGERQTYRGHEDISILAAEFRMINIFIQEVDKSGLKVPSHPNFSHRTEYNDLLHSLEPYNIFKIENEYDRKEVYLKLPPIHYLESFALAQHYGAPTRLLDWSWNVLTAAYFAALGAAKLKSNKMAIYCLHSSTINQLEDNENISILTVPRVDNPNLNAQKGFFSIDRYAFNKDYCFSDEIKKLLKKNYYEVSFIKIEIDGSLAPKLLRELYQLGYSAKYLFPGYGGIIEGLKEIKYWDDPTLSYFEKGWWS